MNVPAARHGGATEPAVFPTVVNADTVTVRALQPADQASVVEVDTVNQGRLRRESIVRRLRTARQQPQRRAQFAAMRGNELIGC